MIELLVESLSERIAVALSAVGSAVFTLGGLLAEQAGLHELAVGHSVVGTWEMVFGAVVLVVGLYVLGYGEFWRRVRSRRGTDAGR